MKSYLLLIIFGVAVTLCGVGFYFYKAQQTEEIHAERDEMEIVVTNIPGVSAELFQAGKDLQSTRKLSVSGSHFWLTRGNYFLVARESGKQFYYPITVLGYGSGPDEGKLKITIRPYPQESPGEGFSFIPSGSFLMGDRLNPQGPQYVWLGAFFIGKYEVTNREFREFLGDRDGYQQDDNWTQLGIEWKKSNSTRCSAALHAGDQDFERFGQDDQPVTEVKWYEANAYAKWFTKKKGAGKFIFALPSEAEWEKAARGPDSFDYGLGSMISDAQSRLYNWQKNPDASVTVVSAMFPDFQPNRYGIYHMSGNVSEWTQSEFLAFNRNHPYDEYSRNHDDSTDQRVVRGGSWYCASIALLSLPYRDAFQPETSTNERGFRLVARHLPG